MSNLEETFGSEFAEKFEKEKQRRRQQREQVSEDTMAAIAEKIVSTDEFSPEEPNMEYQDDTGLTHNVLLMTVPDIESDDKVIWSYMNELDSGAVTMPMEYMGEWMSCLFNVREDVQKLEIGEDYILVGELDQWENDKGELNDQLSPVRGVMTLEEVQEYASGQMASQVNEEPNMDSINEDAEEPSGPPEDALEDAEPTPDEDEEEDTTEEPPEEDEDEEEESSTSPFAPEAIEGDDEEEEEDDELQVTEEDVADHIDQVGQQKEEVWELEEGDPELQDVTAYVMKQEGYDELVEEDAEKYMQAIASYIESQREEEEEEEEDDLDFDDESIFS